MCRVVSRGMDECHGPLGNLALGEVCAGANEGERAAAVCNTEKEKCDFHTVEWTDTLGPSKKQEVSLCVRECSLQSAFSFFVGSSTNRIPCKQLTVYKIEVFKYSSVSKAYDDLELTHYSYFLMRHISCPSLSSLPWSYTSIPLDSFHDTMWFSGNRPNKRSYCFFT